MFHVGGARSALYNWAVAHKAGGTFVLRVEDTDEARNRPEWTEGIIGALAAIGINASDPAFEGPYFQSQNTALHREKAVELFDAGRAYYCDCTREDLEARTGSKHLGYDGFCRDRGLPAGEGRALRFRTPDEGVTVVADLVRGDTEFPNASLEDFVVARGNGSAVFLLANVVDDVDQRITIVIRGEEHLSNAAKQQLLWEALGATAPQWAHLPVIVNEKRQKLSKRRDKVALESYLDEGYLPEALVNYLFLLGWGPKDDVEIRPYAELEQLFDLRDVNKSSAFFDVKKLSSFNADYIRALDADAFVKACEPWVLGEKAPWAKEAYDPAVFAEVAPLVQTRITVLDEVPMYVDFLFLDAPAEDEAAWAKAMKPGAADVLASAREELAGAEWNVDALKAAVEAAGAAHGLKLSKSQAPVRVAVTGRTIGLPLFESLQVLGRDRVLSRIDAALARLATAQ
ncbi:glutamate--tRNA ligase [Embleya sp. NPDC050154]|uniref:glutamate--tRNA ligase n=1 Tax=unclassified Embleya TaxID=2699296 RepID=UPI0037B436F3